jgi:hypothetical protein
MKAIIDGKRFDTEKAIACGSDSYNGSRTDFGWWTETLYRTPRSGAFFLAGEGHARSHYARSLGGGSWGPGEKITPLTADEALAWAEQHLPADQIEALFADRIADA